MITQGLFQGNKIIASDIVQSEFPASLSVHEVNTLVDFSTGNNSSGCSVSAHILTSYFMELFPL